MLQSQGAATHSTNVWDVAFANDELSVATTARGELRIWSLPSGQLACKIDGSYYAARVRADGIAGYHVTIVDYDMRSSAQAAQRAFRLDPTSCAQTPVAFIAGATGSYSPVLWVVRAPDGRILPNGFATAPESRLEIRSAGQGYVVSVQNGARLESVRQPSATDLGSVMYACTSTDKKREYHRAQADGRFERIGQADVSKYGMGACGALRVTPDGKFLTDAGAGAIIDLDRKRVIASYPLSQSTSVGVDVGTGRAAFGFSAGAVIVDLGSGRDAGRLGGSSTYGYVSPTIAYIAIASSLVSRPLVELRTRSGSTIALDDARSRQGADILMAGREAERVAREARDRREREAAEAERARQAAAREARHAAVRSIVERSVGTISQSATLRQIQYQGGYDWIEVSLNIGDVVVLASEDDGAVTFSINDGTKVISSDPNSGLPTSGFQIVRTTLIAAINGKVMVNGRGSVVHVFIVRRDGVRR
jgi:hypothetical protein